MTKTGLCLSKKRLTSKNVNEKGLLVLLESAFVSDASVTDIGAL